MLSVDGGVGPATIADCADAGAELFVVGSAIFDEVDYGTAMHELAHCASQAASSSL
ncbi:MAG: hypothetical protein ACYTGL_09250 [Planctomycetota bacterium]